MARLSTRSVKSRQNRVLRYVASTDSDKTAADLNVSQNTLNRFLRAKPETIKKNPDRYRKLLESNPEGTAKEKNVKLVQRLSGKRKKEAYARRGESERLQRAIRLSNVTQERYKTEVDGQTVYRPYKPTRVKASREQILNNMAGDSQASILDQVRKGIITRNEGRTKLRKLYRNSDLTNAQADSAFEKGLE